MESIQTRPTAKQAMRGKKRTCLKEDCGENFYDLNKDPMACPYCGTAFVAQPDVVYEPKPNKRSPFYKLEKPRPVVEAAEVGDDEQVDAADAESVEVDVEDTGGDASLLDAEEDDLGDKADVGEIPASGDDN